MTRDQNISIHKTYYDSEDCFECRFPEKAAATGIIKKYQPEEFSK